MDVVMFAAVLVIGYLFGSFPSGYILMRFFLKQDVRETGSGRTGTTNVFRAGGGKIALLTGVLDALKATLAVYLTQWLLPGNYWAAVLTGVMAIIGHIYSIFIGFKGGAGGAPTVGGAFALWPGTLLFILPVGIATWYGIGYASLATISFGVVTIVVMAYRWLTGAGPLEYVWYGIFALLACLWTLRPNIRRLLRGEERVVGWRAKRMKQQGIPNPPQKSVQP